MVIKIQQQEVRVFESLNVSKIQRNAIIKAYIYICPEISIPKTFVSSKRHNSGPTAQGT